MIKWYYYDEIVKLNAFVPKQKYIEQLEDTDESDIDTDTGDDTSDEENGDDDAESNYANYNAASGGIIDDGKVNCPNQGCTSRCKPGRGLNIHLNACKKETETYKPHKN